MLLDVQAGEACQGGQGGCAGVGHLGGGDLHLPQLLQLGDGLQDVLCIETVLGRLLVAPGWWWVQAQVQGGHLDQCCCFG